MEYKEEILIDLVEYFGVSISKDYEGWKQEEAYQKFEKDGYAVKNGSEIKLTENGKQLLHDFIEKKTNWMLEIVRDRYHGNVKVQRFFRENVDQQEIFFRYIIKNEKDKKNSRIENAEDKIIIKDN